MIKFTHHKLCLILLTSACLFLTLVSFHGSETIILLCKHWTKSALTTVILIVIALRISNLYWYSIVLVSLILYTWFKCYEWRYQIHLVAHTLQVSMVLYSEEEFSGFGPGNNAAGILVYKLPNHIAREIKKIGIVSFFKTHQPTQTQHNWHHTPIYLSNTWAGQHTKAQYCPELVDYKIENYVSQYNFDISISSSIQDKINNALTNPGSFIACDNKILIVAPDIGWVIYAYH